MKYIKTYESKNDYLLCVKSTDPHFYWKFTKGNKYKIYKSNTHGKRLRDDNNKFCGIDHWNKKRINSIVYEYSYADGILTADNSIEEYEIRKNSEKYNL